MLFAAALLVTAFTGCTDDLSSLSEPANQVESPAITNNAKFRHAKFVRRAMRKRVGKDGEEDYLGLIVSVNNAAQLDKVIERMKTLERYKILERYTYDEVFDGIAVEITDSLANPDYSSFLQSLLSDPDVQWIEPDMTVELPPASSADAGSGQTIPWSVAAIGGQDTWTHSGDGSGSVDVDVYILDTGVSNDDVNVVEHRDRRNPSVNDPADYDGHGTHVAGIAAAIDNAFGVVGVAPGARVHNFKVLNDDGTAPTSVVLEAVEELLSRKLANPSTPMVANLSLGENVETTDFTALDDAVQAAIDAGVVMVVAAGNWGMDASVISPAHVPDVITVGASDMSAKFTDFSNYGAFIDIVAPGQNIISLAPSTMTAEKAEMSGTSMAAPHVTGAVALYLAKHPNATAAQVRDALVTSSMDVVRNQPSNTTSNLLWLGNQVDNPGLKNGKSDWYTNGNISFESMGGGDKAAKLSSGHTLAQSFPATSGTTYRANIRYKVEGVPSWSGYGFDYRDANGNEISESVASFNKLQLSYGDLELTGTAPEGTKSISLWITTSGSLGKLYVDNVEVYAQ